MEALLEAGFDVFLLDWGDPSRADSHRGFDAYVATLRDAEAAVLSASGRRRLHLVGYCAGALTALTRVVRFDDAVVASLTAIAPPVDYAVPAMASTSTNSAARAATSRC
ncbi:MAG: alpha/beta fold hydrolase [Candidatus Dormibacteria bacterium]